MFIDFKKYNIFLLCTIILNTALLSNPRLISEEEIASHDETAQSAGNHIQSDETQENKTQEKKPTFKESWRKVVTLRWKELGKADAWNIGAPIASVSTTILLCYYLPQNSIPNTQNYDPAHNNSTDKAHRKPVITRAKENQNIPEKDTPTPSENDLNDNAADSTIDANNLNLPNNNAVQPFIPFTQEQRKSIARLIENVDNEIFIDDVQHKIARTMIADIFIASKICQEHPSPISAIAIDENIIVAGYQDGTIVISDIETGQLLHTLQEDSILIDLVIISGNKAISLSNNGKVRIWDIETGNLLNTLADTVLSVAASGDRIITRALNHVATIWDINGTLQGELDNDNDLLISSIAIKDDTAVIGLYGGDTNIWDIPSGQLRQTLVGHDNTIRSTAIRGEIVITASNDKTVKIWNIDGTLQYTFPKYIDTVASVAIDNNIILTTSDEGLVSIWNIHGQLLHKIQKNNYCNSIAINDNKVVTGFNNIIHIWQPLSMNSNASKLDMPEFKWIKSDLLPMQANLIARIYAENKTINKRFSIINGTEDAKIWITFPDDVRIYLMDLFDIQLLNSSI